MRSAELARLMRYGITGAGSASTHLGVLALLAEGLHVWPVAASMVGFGASVVVSYLLQRVWVFRSATSHAVSSPRFVVVTAVAFGCNAGIVWTGTEVFGWRYPAAQAVALVVVPLINYSLNSRWTFAPATQKSLA